MRPGLKALLLRSTASVAAGNLSVLALIAGGGGGGGANNTGTATGGGGGGGEVNTSLSFSLAVGTYPVVVGAGGGGVSTTGTGATGSNTTFNGYTALGGLGGTAADGGVGGAAGGTGGGAGGNGGSGGSAQGLNGAAGTTTTFDGTTRNLGGGGGGGGTGGSAREGLGWNGGGDGGDGTSDVATVATANTGAGGGGGGKTATTSQNNGTNGGSGIAIVKYLTTDAIGFLVYGGTKSTSGSYTVHTFLSNDSLTVSRTLSLGMFNAFANYTDHSVIGGNIEVGVRRDGTTYITGLTVGALVPVSDWITPKSATVGDAYDVKLTVLGGNTVADDGVWLALNSNRSWMWDASAGPGDSKSAQCQLAIRPTGGGATLATASFSIEAHQD